MIEFDGIENNRTSVPVRSPKSPSDRRRRRSHAAARRLSVWRGGAAVHLPFPISISWIWIFPDAAYGKRPEGK